MAITDYGYKRKITIDHTVVDATETDYPAMVKLYQDDTAPTWSSGGSYTENDKVKHNGHYYKKSQTTNNAEPHVGTDWFLDWYWLGIDFDFSKVQSDGKDIRFTPPDGQTLLDYERELFEKLENQNRAYYDFSTISTMPTEFSNTGLETFTITNNQLTLGDTYDDSVYDSYCSIPTSLENDFNVNIDFDVQTIGSSDYLIGHKLEVTTNSDDTYAIIFADSWGVSSSYPHLRIEKNNTQIYESEDFFTSKGVYNFKILRSGSDLEFYVNEVKYHSVLDSNKISEIRLYTNDVYSGLLYENFKIDNIEIIGSFDDTVYHQSASLSEVIQPSKAVFHVRIPSVSSTEDTKYLMFYNNPSETVDGENKTGVWDSNFVMVHHMGTSLTDSTGNGNDGTNYGTTVLDGLNGKARSFDGVDDYIVTDYYHDTNDKTLTYLANFQENESDFQVCGANDGNNRRFYFGIGSPSENYGFRIGYNDNIDIKTDLTSPLNEYVTMALKGDNGNYTAYQNYSTQRNGTYTTKSETSADAFYIGALSVLNRYIKGTIDEVRISNTARSDAWIKMDDANLRTWSLQSVGLEESTVATNTTETLAKTLIDENLVNATDTDRNISILSVVESQGRGTVQEVETLNERLDKILEKILAVDDYGHKIYIDDGLKYDVIVPETKSVQFSNKIYNLLEARQQLSESNYKTFVYIDGDTTTDTFGTSTGFDRKELYLTSTTDTGLQDKAKQELDGKYYQTNAIQGKIRIVGNPFEYKTDYDLGDIVTVIFNNTVYTVQITEITETYTPNGFELDLTFGTPRRDFSTLIQDIKEAK